MNEGSLDHVFAALAHPERRRMLDLLCERPGMCVGELAEKFAMSRVAVMKHLKVLEQADLIISRKAGRVRSLYFNVVPIQRIHDRWSDRYAGFWAGRMADLKARIEGEISDKHSEQGQVSRKGKVSRAG